MASSYLLPSSYIDKLQVNRLNVQEIRSDNILSLNPSYLFSAVFNGNFSRNSTGGTLTFTKSDVDSIIQFSDRPFRQTNNITFEQFVFLFSGLNIDSNTFAEDNPNVVLVHEEEQRTYIIRLLSTNLDSAIFNLELIAGETHNASNINGRMSFFVDSTKSIYNKVKKIVKQTVLSQASVQFVPDTVKVEEAYTVEAYKGGFSNPSKSYTGEGF